MSYISLIIRHRCIKLNCLFARNVSGVFNRYDSGDRFRIEVPINGIKRLGERRVGQSVAERPYNFIVIVPARCAFHCAYCTACARGRIKVSVGVTRLIVLVADINAFCVNGVSGCSHRFGIKLYSVGLVRLTVTYGTDLVGIRVSKDIPVLRRGRCRVICSISVGQFSGRVNLSGKDVDHSAHTVSAWRTYPHNGIRFKLAVFFNKLGNFHHGVRVDKHDNFIRVILCHFDHSTLVVRKTERVFGARVTTESHITGVCVKSSRSKFYTLLSGNVVTTLGVYSAEHYDRSGIVAEISRAAGYFCFKFRKSYLVDVVIPTSVKPVFLVGHTERTAKRGYGTSSGSMRYAAVSSLRVNVLRGIRFLKIGIDRELLFRKRVFQRYACISLKVSVRRRSGTHLTAENI